jgi:hypothetical protein
MIFNNYIVIKIPVREENSDFYEILIEAGGDFSAAWSEIYFPTQSLTRFYNALNHYAKKYDKPINYVLDETISISFSKHSKTGSIEVVIHMSSNGCVHAYSEITVQTNITEMDSFINGIGNILNNNSCMAFLGSDKGRFI